MAFACDIHEFRITAPTPPGAVRPIRSILSTSKRNECRQLLLPAATEQAELSSKLWSRKRRRKLAAVVHNRRTAKLLYKLKFQQHNRPIRPRRAPAVSRTNESAKERQSAGNAVPGGRRWKRRQTISADGLRSGSASNDSRRRAASHRVSSLAMGRPGMFQRDQADTQVSQRARSHLRLLQSRSLESSLSSR